MKNILTSLLLLLASISLVIGSSYYSKNRRSENEEALVYSVPSIDSLYIKNSSSKVKIAVKNEKYWGDYERSQNTSLVKDSFLVSQEGGKFIEGLRELKVLRKLTPTTDQRLVIEKLFVETVEVAVNGADITFELSKPIFGSSKAYLRYLDDLFVVDSKFSTGVANFRSKFFERKMFYNWPKNTQDIFLYFSGFDYTFKVSDSHLANLTLEGSGENQGVSATGLSSFIIDVSKLSVREYLNNANISNLRAEGYVMLMELRLDHTENCLESCYQLYKLNKAGRKPNYFFYLPNEGYAFRLPNERLTAALGQLIK